LFLISRFPLLSCYHVFFHKNDKILSYACFKLTSQSYIKEHSYQRLNALQRYSVTKC
jgi:hypothetical protein